MWILALAPIIVGFILALASVTVLAAEVVGKGAIGAVEAGWTAVKPSTHRRTAR